MTALAPRPVAEQEAVPAAGPRPGAGAAIGCVAMLIGAVLPLDRVFADRSWLGPVIGAALLAFGLAWLLRRVGAGPVLALLGSQLGLLWFAAVTLLPDTLAGGILPAPGTFRAAASAWAHGVELLRVRPTPALPETGLVLLTVTGVWVIGHAAHELVFRAHAALRAVLMTLLLWIVPLGLAPKSAVVWPWAVPYVAGAALLLLGSSEAEAARWGRWITPDRRGPRGLRRPLAWAMGAAAVALGVAAAPLLPGWTDPALYELRDLGGSTLTSNPIVNIRASLLSPDPRPMLTVRVPRPVYLRATSLDRYSDREEWTNTGIRGLPLRRGRAVPFEVPIASPARIPADVRIGALANSVLVPMPYQPERVEGPLAEVLQYDRRLSTFTLDSGVRLAQDDSYAVQSALPAPDAAQLDAVPAGWYGGALLDLPPGVPAEVAELARTIARDAGATTPFRQALAIQDELRSWDYSLDPPAGHSGDAMRTFLRNRTGYCEQFAGTMAVMLRTLGIPARVGVGFSPGELIDPAAGEYLVRAANAHAWVEVLFPGEGWIVFEPTPRSDGNVLVPSATNVAPSSTVAQGPVQPQPTVTPTATPRDRLPTPTASPSRTPQPGPATGEGNGGARALLWIALVLASCLGLAAVGARRLRVDVDALGPAERVVHAVARVELIARALGRERHPSETDREFVGRLTRADFAPVLASHAERARYAPRLPLEAIREAEDVAGRLIDRLLEPLDRRARVRIRAKASLLGLRDAAADRLRTRRLWRRGQRRG
jgi:transglutaminase-like putative cysteine protease